MLLLRDARTSASLVDCDNKPGQLGSKEGLQEHVWHRVSCGVPRKRMAMHGGPRGVSAHGWRRAVPRRSVGLGVDGQETAAPHPPSCIFFLLFSFSPFLLSPPFLLLPSLLSLLPPSLPLLLSPSSIHPLTCEPLYRFRLLRNRACGLTRVPLSMHHGLSILLPSYKAIHTPFPICHLKMYRACWARCCQFRSGSVTCCDR